MCLARASDPRCGFLVTVYDLIWPEGGLCELEKERSPVRFYCEAVEESLGSYSCPSINWLMRNSFMWKTEWITHRRYTHTYMHINTHIKTLTGIQVHPLEVNGVWLSVLTNRWWIGHSYAHMYSHTHIHKYTHLRWWIELPCCVDLYQSRDIKLNWQTGSRTTPTLHSAALGRLSVHVCVVV